MSAYTFDVMTSEAFRVYRQSLQDANLTSIMLHMHRVQCPSDKAQLEKELTKLLLKWFDDDKQKFNEFLQAGRTKEELSQLLTACQSNSNLHVLADLLSSDTTVAMAKGLLPERPHRSFIWENIL